jgi:hypothetical protein
MNRRVLEQVIAWLLLFIWGLVVLHAPLTVWLVSHGVPVWIKGWKEALMIIAAALLLIHTLRLKRFTEFTRDPLMWVAIAYGALNLIMALCMPTTLAATLAGLAINLRYVLYFMLVYVFIRLHPTYVNSFLKIGKLGAGIVVGFAILQIFLPHDFLKYLGYSEATIAPYLTVDENTAYIRENSTLRGPNPLGAYAGSVAILAAAYMTQRWAKLKRYGQRWALIGILSASLVALWVSYSRSALVATTIGMICVLAVKFTARMRPMHWGTLVLGTLVLVCVGWALRDSSFVHNVILHDNPTTGASVDSNAGHLSSLQDGLARMVSQPFGAGVGSTGSASLLSDSGLIIENQYLMVAHEVGWLGLGIFIWFFYLVMTALWHRRKSWLALGVWASGISLALIGLVLPVWVDDTVSIIWWGLAALVIAKEASHGTTTDKKTA